MAYKRRGREGVWTADWVDGNGKRHQVTCSTKKQAEDLEREHGTVGGSILVSTYYDKWIVKQIPWVSKRQHLSYQWAFNKHLIPAIGKLRIDEVESTHINDLRTAKLIPDEKGKKLKKSSVRKMTAAGAVMFDQAIEDKLIKINPFKIMSKSKKRLMDAPEDEDTDLKAMTTEQMIAFVKHDHSDILLTMVLTGLRPGEARALAPHAIDFQRQKLKVLQNFDIDLETKRTKTKRIREVDIADDLVPMLKARVEHATTNKHQYLFLNRDGNPIYPQRLREWMQVVLTRAELPSHFTPHCLRHTYASQLLSRGYPVVYVQQQLGHQKIGETVDTYGAWLPAEAKGAVNELATVVNLAEILRERKPQDDDPNA